MELAKGSIFGCNFEKEYDLMKPIKILKNRSDIGAGTRGSDMGIDALEIAAINSQNDFFNLYPYVDILT
ncbi:MAG: hypothetical protein VW080_09815, partial [Flavobacteriaceae bacterium]